MTPAVGAYCLRSVLFTGDTEKWAAGINPTHLAATSLMSRCLSCGAESRGRGSEMGEGAIRRALAPAAFAAVSGGGYPRGKNRC